MYKIIYVSISMELNTKKLEEAIENSPLSKVQIAERCGISRVTLDSVLKGKEIGLYKFVKIASMLNLKMSFLFDETVEIRQAGRDYREHDNSQHSGTEYHANTITVGEVDLEAENKRLQAELIKAQARIIELLDK